MDGILHKDFNTTDYSFEFGKKKRSLSANSSLYYGMPYKIYSSNYIFTSINALFQCIFCINI